MYEARQRFEQMDISTVDVVLPNATRNRASNGCLKSPAVIGGLGEVAEVPVFEDGHVISLRDAVRQKHRGGQMARPLPLLRDISHFLTDGPEVRHQLLQ